VKLVVPLSATILTYLLLSLVWGEYGLIAHRRLEAYEQRLDANIERLDERQRELEAETRSLRTDADRIRVEARRLGYFEENEGLVRLESYDPQPGPASPGALVKRRTTEQPVSHAAAIRAVAASAGLFALFLMLLLDSRTKR